MNSGLKFEFMGETYHIKFFHKTFTEIHRNKPLQVKYTECKILRGKNRAEMELMFIGSARCSVKDNFSKDIGRKLSLKDALSMRIDGSINDKEFRTLAWNAYFGR